MKHELPFVSILFVFSAVFLPTVFAGEGNDNPALVWKRYLSASEQTALGELMAEFAEQQPSDAEKSEASPEAQLAAMREGYAEMASFIAPPLADVKSEPFSENGVKGLWFKPDAAARDKVLLYLHGGGYVVGSPTTGAAIAGFLAREAGMTCFSLDYPLAPEFPFPAALDNAVAAYRLLLDKGFKPDNIVLAGDSAGGGLVLALLVDLRGQSLPMPAGAYLLSPWTDLGNGFASHETKRFADPVVSRDFLEALAAMYAGGNPRNSPRLSPAFADLRDLPPLLIHVGSNEVLLDDSMTVARNAAMANVPVALTVWPGYGHVFQMMHGRLEGGRKALEDGAAFFRDVTDKALLRPRDER